VAQEADMTNTNAHLEETPEWQLARSSGATAREVTELVAGTVREHRGDYTTPYTEGPIPDKLTAAGRKAIQVTIGRYAAARAAGYDDARARVHVDGPSAERITTDRAQADRTAAAEGLVWIPAQRGARRPLAPDWVSIITLDGQSGRVFGWWYLPSVAAVLRAVP